MSDDLAGRTLGRYQVLERLGRGGMAEVYRAYQPSLDRYVAIKVIYPHLASDPALLERFGREARAVATLHHPNIVQVHDFDVQGSSAFMAMEFVSGPTLKAAIQALHQNGQLLPLPVVGQIIGQLADALDYAHEQRVVHRDVKPANVLLRRRGPADAPLGATELQELLLNLGPTSVVLTDFGVARIVNDSVEHTAAGTILGSPAYMSPEQGRGERVGPGSDIYSLGVVLYELLTGQVPFDADTPFAIVLKHTTAPLPPPRALRPDIPDTLERVLLKALAKEPADRFQNAGAFGAAVREATPGSTAGPFGRATMRFGEDISATTAPRTVGSPLETRIVETSAVGPLPAPELPVAAAPPKPTSPRRGLGRRAAIITLVSLFAITAVVLIAFFAGGALTIRGLSEVGALVVPSEFSQQATEAAVQGTVIPINRRETPVAGGPSALPDPDDPVAVALAAGRAACGGPQCPGGSAGEALAIYDAALVEEPDNAALHAARARLYIWWDAGSYAEQARADIAAALDEDDDNPAAYIARADLVAALAQSDTERAGAIDDYNRAVELDPEGIDGRLARAAFLAFAPDLYEPNSPSRAQIIADCNAVLARDPQNITALNLRADLRYAAAQYDEALADSDAVLVLDPANFSALMLRGRTLRFQMIQPQAALESFTAALAIEPDNVEARESHAALQAILGDYPGALEDMDALVRLDPNLAFAYVLRGFVRLGLAQPAEAQQNFDEALSIEGGLGEPETLDARYGRGLALLAQGEASAAIPDLEAAAAEYELLYYVKDTFLAGRVRVHLDLAQAYSEVGRGAEAGALLDTAVEVNQGWYLPHLERARLRIASGDSEGARTDLRSAGGFATSDAERAEVEGERARLP